MTRQEIMAGLAATQIALSAHSQALTGLIQTYASASMLQDRARQNILRDQIHNTIDLSLDANDDLSHFTRALINLNDY